MVYYELTHDCAGWPSKPNLRAGIFASDNERRVPATLAFNAQRIWKETTDGVEFLKHPELKMILVEGGDREEVPVDMQEFTWIKLTAKVL